MTYRIVHAIAFTLMYLAIMALCSFKGWTSFASGATAAMLAFTLADIAAAAVREWRNGRAARPTRAQDVCMPMDEVERRQRETNGWWYFVILVCLSGWLSVELLRMAVPAFVDAMASLFS